MTDHQRDVVFTPFMLRVREALHGDGEPATLHFESSRSTGIAVAVNEWFELRARAEHVISEANAMLAPGAQRIELEDEFGTDHLSFVLKWRDRSLRIGVSQDVDPRHGHVVTEGSSFSAIDQDMKPVDQDFLEDLAVSLVSISDPTVEIAEETDQ